MFTYPFNKYLLSARCVPGTVLGIADVAVTKKAKRKNPGLEKLIVIQFHSTFVECQVLLCPGAAAVS